MTDGPELVVLGLGNVLCSDDGLGPAAVARLHREWAPPPAVSVVDGGTLGLALTALVDSAEALILVDAIAGDAPPGTPVRLEGDDVPPAVLHRLSPHQVGVADLLDTLRLLGRTPPRVILLGLVPASLDLDLALTPPVAAGLPGLVDAILAEAAALGHPFRRRPAGDLARGGGLGAVHELGP